MSSAVAAAASVASFIYSVSSGSKADQRADEANELARQQAKQDALNDILNTQQQASDISTSIAQTEVDIAEAQSKITGYQSFLNRFQEYKESQKTSAEVGVLQANTGKTELVSSGKAAYENLMQTLGYTDAVAGATGRSAAGTSMAAIGAKATENLVDYVGEDRTLDENGGLFGEQLGVANKNIEAQTMAYDQLLLDLEAEKGEAEANLGIWSTSITTLKTSQDTMRDTLDKTNQRITDMQEWVETEFKDPKTLKDLQDGDDIKDPFAEDDNAGN